jgi:hypothetical protein
MGLVNEAFETTGIILGEDGGNVGIFSAGVLPHVAVPDAPIYTIYYRTNGETYRLISLDGSISGNWELQEQGVSLDLELGFYNSDGTPDHLPITSFNLEFYNSDGTRDDINIT